MDGRYHTSLFERNSSLMAKRSQKRHQLLIKAAMRVEEQCSDVWVCNMSCFGMMIRTAGVPRVGSEVEVVGGNIHAIGRVTWSRNGRLGIRTHDKIPTVTTADDYCSSRLLNKVVELLSISALVAFVPYGFANEASQILNAPVRLAQILSR